MKTKVAILTTLLISANTIGASALNIVVNGAVLQNAEPKMISNRTFVPVASIAQATDANVQWNAPEKTVVIHKDNNELKIKIGSKTALKNDTPIELDAPAKVLKGKTYVPLSFIATNLDIPVVYDNATKTVYVGEAAMIPVPAPGPTNQNNPPQTQQPSTPSTHYDPNWEKKHVVTDSPKEGVWIKGNRNTMIYHIPSGRDYYKVSAHNIVWFETEDEAIAAGYRRAKV